MWCTYLAVALLVAYADAYGTGAPKQACLDMTPQHGDLKPQTIPAPYTIIPGAKTVKAGSPMEVVITGNSPSNTIRGLMLQARQGKKILGKFVVPGNVPFQLLECASAGDTVTHKKHSNPEQTVKFTWTPPTDFTGDMKFRATIAQTGAVFWIGVESDSVTVN